MRINSAASLCAAPNALAAHYTRARVSERVLLTGHSHQAWPDRGALGQLRAWDDAVEYLDMKWERAFERADRVREGFARLLDAAPETICLGSSTHDLVVRWLSALPLRERPCLITTDAEFHSARRQLTRLEEEGIRVQRMAAYPSATVGERLARAVDDRASAVIVSTVFYDSAEIACGLGELAQACDRHGVALLLDVYHQLNVVPFSLREQGLESAFVTGGGYKYCQLGEGNCFLRAPADCTLRPVVTGWFAEFGTIQTVANTVSYGTLSTRFAGATYDPTSHYRAAEVFDFFADMDLTPALLREVSQHQIALLRSGIAALDLPTSLLTAPDLTPDRIAGFLALRSPRAAEVQRALADRDIFTDCRRDVLRLGPAPYLNDDQLLEAVSAVDTVVRALI